MDKASLRRLCATAPMVELSSEIFLQLLDSLDAAEARAEKVEQQLAEAKRYGSEKYEAAIKATNAHDHAWKSVWEKLCAVGLLSFIGGDGTGVGRAVAFIGALAAQKAADERMRAALLEIKEEVDKAYAWHSTTGMKVARTPPLMPSTVHWLKPIVDAALSPAPAASDVGAMSAVETARALKGANMQLRDPAPTASATASLIDPCTVEGDVKLEANSAPPASETPGWSGVRCSRCAGELTVPAPLCAWCDETSTAMAPVCNRHAPRCPRPKLDPPASVIASSSTSIASPKSAIVYAMETNRSTNGRSRNVEMNLLLSIDPGKRGCGCALWKDGQLLQAAYVAPPKVVGPLSEIVDATATAVLHWLVSAPYPSDAQLVVELPQTYGGRADKGDANVLIELAAVVGCLQGALGWSTRYVRPREWGGNVPKNIKNQRAREKLSASELQRVKLPRAKSLHHNIFDGIAIGLWVLKR